MLDMDAMLCEVYNAETAVIIPGSGSYAMEAVARQFATGKKAMSLRNGYFSWRWTDIFETCDIPYKAVVAQAGCVDKQPGCGTSRCPCGSKAQYAPMPIDDLEEYIHKEKPDVFFAPHVETSTGILLPDEYIKRAAAAVHANGGLFVLDCIASGTLWVDMKEMGIDALITAPQKGWTGPACAGIVMLSEDGLEATRRTSGTSLCCNLGKWLSVMDAYKSGGFAYHTTMPTDALVVARDAMVLTKQFGFERARAAALELGARVRSVLCEDRGLVSVAAPGFEAPGVVVVHTDDGAILSKFLGAGTQIAAGVPFKIGEHPGTKTFRIGLFGLDKLADPAVTCASFEEVLNVAVPKAAKAAAAAA
mmetsp:Transcript_10989/g.31955  ORF Transcript_10989/g.31955 Transcript_10989/m.31955 type:complete len:362 (+) Transcript_10989:259-1344(+)